MAKFIDPFTDTGFKIIFGRENVSNELLVSFLNALLTGQPGFDRIVTVRYPNAERSRDWVEGKTIVYDVYCETERGHRFIVEMQKSPQENFMSRAIYYVSRSVADQGYKGKKENIDSGIAEYWNYALLPVVGVFFSNFYIPGLEKKPVVHAMIADMEGGKPISLATRYAFIQLPAFNIEKEEDCHTDFDKWIYSLKNMKTMQTMPFTSHNDIFQRLANVGSVANLSPEERVQYEYDLKKARDYSAEMAYARKAGLEQGIQQGIQQGIAEGRAEGRAEGLEQGRADAYSAIIKRMNQMGHSYRQIADTIGIKENEVENIINR